MSENPIIVVMDQTEFATTMLAITELLISIEDGTVSRVFDAQTRDLYNKMLVCFTDAGYTPPRGTEIDFDQF